MTESKWEILRQYAYTDRQIEIIDYKIQGLSNSKIANKLQINERVVERHLQK